MVKPDKEALEEIRDRSLRVSREGDATLRALAYPTGFLRDRFDFLNEDNEWRRLFAELLGTFFLVLVAAGADMVNVRFGGHAVGAAARVTAPGLMVGVLILFMGSVSGAHLNPGVSLAFALRGDFPWKRVPAYVVVQVLGAVLAMYLLVGLVGKQGVAGLTLPGDGVSAATAMWWEMVLTIGLVSTVLGTSSGAQNVGPLNAIGVGAYITLAGLWGAPISGASMNSVRSLAPALVLNDWTAWWSYLAGPMAGAIIAVGIAWVLRGPGGGVYGKRAAQGTLGWLWHPGPVNSERSWQPPEDER